MLVEFAWCFVKMMLIPDPEFTFAFACLYYFVLCLAEKQNLTTPFLLNSHINRLVLQHACL